MAKITFITGGQRSGKSSYAMKRALKQCSNPVYLATARNWDTDFNNRIQRHKIDRTDDWSTIEEDIELSKHDLVGRIVVLDCITLWLTNIFTDNNFNLEISLEKAKNEFQKFVKPDFDLFVITNELGMGIHAQTESGRKFTDLQGWMNQFIASISDEVILLVSGIPVTIASKK